MARWITARSSVHTWDMGALAADDFGPAYGVTGWTLNSGKWTKWVETTDATSMRARARASWGLTGAHGVSI